MSAATLRSVSLADPGVLPDFTVQRLLDTGTLDVRDVSCSGGHREPGPEERTAATQLVFPYRGVYVHHVGSEQAVAEANQVVFRVTLDATKPAIAKAVADLFKVKVKAVNTITVKGKQKFARGKKYTRSDIKKAIVTLEEGHQIDITTGL